MILSVTNPTRINYEKNFSTHEMDPVTYTDNPMYESLAGIRTHKANPPTKHNVPVEARIEEYHRHNTTRSVDSLHTDVNQPIQNIFLPILYPDIGGNDTEQETAQYMNEDTCDNLSPSFEANTIGHQPVQQILKPNSSIVCGSNYTATEESSVHTAIPSLSGHKMHANIANTRPCETDV